MNPYRNRSTFDIVSDAAVLLCVIAIVTIVLIATSA